jgi:hypothetical protein
MDQKHTKEPWSVGDNNGFTCVYAETDGEVCSGFYGSTSNAARIVACVNACANIPTEALEAGVIGEMVFALETISSAFNDIDRSERYDVLFDEIKAMQAYVLPKISGD